MRSWMLVLLLAAVMVSAIYGQEAELTTKPPTAEPETTAAAEPEAVDSTPKPTSSAPHLQYGMATLLTVSLGFVLLH